MMPPTAPPLAQACLDHLRIELESLTGLNRALHAIRQALLAGDHAFESHRSILADYHNSITHARLAFRQVCSAMTGTANPTLGSLVTRLDEPWAGAVRDLRQRLISLGIETRELSRRVVAILTFCDAVSRRMVADLLGLGNAVDRYGPDGSRLGDGPRFPEIVTGAA